MSDTVHFAEGTETGGEHTVGVFDLRVFILSEGGHWYAQGAEIDYLAVGDSLEAVKRAFEDGLRDTIAAYLHEHGSIEGLVVEADPSELREFESHSTCKGFRFWQLSQHELDIPTQNSLFLKTAGQPPRTIKLAYVEPKAAA